jgi:hypothetical protein
MFMLAACSLVLLVLEAIVGDLTHWETIVMAGVIGGIAGLVLAEVGLRASRP